MLSFSLEETDTQRFLQRCRLSCRLLARYSMTRLFPREVVMLLQLQLEAVCMLNAVLKERRHLLEVTAKSGNSLNIDRFGPGIATYEP